MSAGVVAEGRFTATADGYDEAVTFVEGHSVATERAWVIEGSAGTGVGVASRRDEWVIEFDRPTRKSTDGAKSDALDAVRAAREMLGRKRLSVPRAHDGGREAIRVHAVTRAGAVRARTGAINELKAIIVTADEALTDAFGGNSVDADEVPLQPAVMVHCGDRSGRRTKLRRSIDQRLSIFAVP